jgi:hypothetical protein
MDDIVGIFYERLRSRVRDELLAIFEQKVMVFCGENYSPS